MPPRNSGRSKNAVRKVPGTTRGKRKPVRKPTPAALASASRLASRMPFVHFPASKTLEEWKTWGAFKSRTHLALPSRSSDVFDVLRDSHVFAYAGPCCFASPAHQGDAAAYLDADIDHRWSGEASPFDSGALEGGDARLQPWAKKSVPERWKFFQKQVHSLNKWRQKFEAWLLHCYDNPERYLECSDDRYAAGQPERLRPMTLLQHNGVSGRAKYGAGGCADRRAWTWEARFLQPVPFEEIRLLHLPTDRQQAALEAVQELRFGTGKAPEILPLPTTVAASPEALYLHSREALEELIKS